MRTQSGRESGLVREKLEREKSRGFLEGKWVGSVVGNGDFGGLPPILGTCERSCTVRGSGSTQGAKN